MHSQRSLASRLPLPCSSVREVPGTTALDKTFGPFHQSRHRKWRQGRDARSNGDILYWGEGNGTGSAKLAKRLDTAHKEWVKHLWVEEWGTTKYDCITYEELDPAYRRGIKKGGTPGWIKDRDVRFRKSEGTLETRHPCPYPTPLLMGKGFRTEELQRRTAVDRDGNASYAGLCTHWSARRGASRMLPESSRSRRPKYEQLAHQLWRAPNVDISDRCPTFS